MTRPLLGTALLPALLVGAGAFAANAPGAGPWSVELDGGQADHQVVSSTATAYALRLGYALTPYLRLEGGYSDFGSAAGLKAHGVCVDLRGRVALSQRFGLFARLGAFDDFSGGANGYLGIGLDYDASRRFSVALGYDLYNSVEYDVGNSAYRYAYYGNRLNGDIHYYYAGVAVHF